jgi:DNA-binding NtrC family response regulator
VSRILLLEPREDRREALRRELTRAGFAVIAQGDLTSDLPLADLAGVVCNAALPSGPGLRLLARIEGTPLIVTAEHGSVTAAVAAIKAGARHYVVHPIEPEALIAALRVEISARVGPDPVSRGARAPMPLVAHCGPMTRLLDRLHAAAEADGPVLIRGEVGSGREQIVRLLHAHSRRREGPLVMLNCSRVPDALIEGELFGYEQVALAPEAAVRPGLVDAADEGTLYIEDIADLPPSVQRRLLQVLEEGRSVPVGGSVPRAVDIRLVAATQRELREELESGRFAADLYYRLVPVTLEVPPLRDRESDVPELARHLLREVSSRLNRPEPVLSTDALAAIRSYPWPGNVRELENAIERAVILNRGGPIRPEDLGIEIHRAGVAVGPGADDATSLEDYFVRFVTEHEDQLTETELAEKLGISRKSLWERRQRLNIPRRRTRQRAPRRDS